MPDLIQDTDDFARGTSQALLQGSRFASLASLQPNTGHPQVTRISLVFLPVFGLVSLISDLSDHSKSLRQDQRCSLLIGQPGPKGDPLTHPRLTLTCTSEFQALSPVQHRDLRRQYLGVYPKSKLYIDFADFHFVRFTVLSATLNGGFGKAYRLDKGDIEG